MSVQLDVTAGGRGQDVTVCLLWCITGGCGEGMGRRRGDEKDEEEEGTRGVVQIEIVEGMRRKRRE